MSQLKWLELLSTSNKWATAKSGIELVFFGPWKLGLFNDQRITAPLSRVYMRYLAKPEGVIYELHGRHGGIPAAIDAFVKFLRSEELFGGIPG